MIELVKIAATGLCFGVGVPSVLLLVGCAGNAIIDGKNARAFAFLAAAVEVLFAMAGISYAIWR